MEGRCERHLFDQAVDLCGHCGQEFCADCLVYSFGAAKPPFCLPCAVQAGGVRAGAGFRPQGGRRERKLFAERREAFLAGRTERLAMASPVVQLDDSWMQRVAEA
jgi:hypothetical protein